ncbi:DUF6512 family protein [Alkalibacter mobilis]|uniref:DUF6512 family protein n=1 Tax=Alkalibacter mobilis TaxID=2787712 RepID=UPI0018A049A1|nr:DUF6512 family protein [Alkalibacter mobilis]MBF7096987.1 hypothetical protein [Alkalibacter mobilis]
MNPDKRSRRIKLTGMAVTILLGLVFHELYKSTRILSLGLISPVNESKWEHWKMAYSPMLIVGAFEYFILKRHSKEEFSNYIFALAGGIVVFESTTFGLIELYEVAAGHSELWVHVSTFFLGGISGYITKYYILKKSKPSKILTELGIIILIIQLIVFAMFTFDPPRIEYFRDSLTQTYGIYNIK